MAAAKKTNLSRIASNADITAKKAEFAEKRITAALSIAKMNTEEQLAMAEERKATFTMGEDSAEECVQALVDIFADIKDAKDTLAAIEEVEKYLKEDAE